MQASDVSAGTRDTSRNPSLTVAARLRRERARSEPLCEKIGIPFTVTNRHPQPAARSLWVAAQPVGRLRKSPILSRDQRERAGALNGPGDDCFTGRSGTGQDALDAANCLADSLWILDQSEADVAFAHRAEADSGGDGDQRLLEQEF